MTIFNSVILCVFHTDVSLCFLIGGIYIDSETKDQENIHGSQRQEVSGEERKFHSEEVQDLYSSSNTITVIKTKMIIWERQVSSVSMEGMRNAYILFGIS
jgi:hypothetical protein